MGENQSKRRVRQFIAAMVAFSVGAVILTATPIGAQDSSEFDQFLQAEPSGVDDRQPAARTNEASAIVQPEFTFTPCPEVTDSIVRLYSAYFLRAPDAGGFDFWFEEYGSGRWSLPRMSAFFSQSDEFNDLYGALSDADFIDLIYRNIFGRNADAGGRDYWLGRMINEGLDRGTVMLNFSESEEYVGLTNTYVPLAGYFNWYPDGTEWYCGFDEIEFGIPVQPTYLDVAIYNDGGAALVVTVEQFRNGAWEVLTQSTIDPGTFYISFARPYLDNTVTGLNISASGPFIWTLVYSPVQTPPVRTGWVAL